MEPITKEGRLRIITIIIGSISINNSKLKLLIIKNINPKT